MTDLANYRFVDPRTLAAIGDLPLIARAVVDGFMYGAHPSRMPGAGLEFSQYRSYQAGDDLRRVDWKLYGRSDRYFVRESEIDTSLTLRLVLDATGSMAHADTITKFDYARFAAAALALLAHRQGDAVGLYALNDGELRALRPARGQAALDRLMRELEVINPVGVWPGWNRVEGALAVGGNRGITVILSDLHEHGGEIREAVGKLTAMRHEVVVMHLATRAEIDLSYPGPVTLEEIETGRIAEIDPAREREAYAAAVEREHLALKDEFGQKRVDYARFVLDEPLDGALRAFLAARRRASGAA